MWQAYYSKSYPGSQYLNVIGSHKCEGLFRDPCECLAELGYIARIAAVSVVSSFRFVSFVESYVKLIRVK